MSLNFRCLRPENITDEHWQRHTEYVVFSLMFVGVNTLTEDNLFDTAMRIQLFETASYGQTIRSLVELIETLRPYAKAELSTNVSPMTAAAFYKHVRSVAMSTVSRLERADVIKPIEKDKV